MDDKLIKKITKQAKRWAHSNNFSELAEDMAQDVVISRLKNEKTKISFLCVDFLRKQHGRKNSKTNSLRFEEKVMYVPLTDQNTPTEDNVKNLNSAIDFDKYKHYLDSRDRAIFILKFKWNLTETEIAECFGVSVGRISQKLSQIKERLASVVTL